MARRKQQEVEPYEVAVFYKPGMVVSGRSHGSMQRALSRMETHRAAACPCAPHRQQSCRCPRSRAQWPQRHQVSREQGQEAVVVSPRFAHLQPVQSWLGL